MGQSTALPRSSLTISLDMYMSRLQELRAAGSEELPTTSIRWRPLGASKTKNVLLAANSDGSVSHWHVTSGKCLHSIKDENNQLYCIDYKADGSVFATAGKAGVGALLTNSNSRCLNAAAAAAAPLGCLAN